MDSHLKETRLDGETVYKGGFLKVELDRVSLPDGTITKREYIRHPGAVVILALFDDDTVLVERQFRYPVGQVFIEFPAGKIDAGEDHLACAKRELQEETTIHNAIGYSDEALDIYLARNLTAGPAQLDAGEFLDVYKATVPELLAQVKSGAITDVKTIIGTFWLEKILAGDWKPA
jgi:ADP-ribose pyrophosphatase